MKLPGWLRSDKQIRAVFGTRRTETELDQRWPVAVADLLCDVRLDKGTGSVHRSRTDRIVDLWQTRPSVFLLSTFREIPAQPDSSALDDHGGTPSLVRNKVDEIVIQHYN